MGIKTFKVIRLTFFLTILALLGDRTPLAKESFEHAAGTRLPASYTSESAKELSSSYIGFYNRHDEAGCLHAGLASASLATSGATSDQVKLINLRLYIAKQYCTADKVTRAEAVKAIRESIKILMGHSMAELN